MSEFFKKMIKHNKDAALIAESELFNEKELTELPVYILNIAHSGKLRGGLGSGLHFWAAPSKHFKTLAGLISISAYLKKYPDAWCIFYDSEFGSTLSYWKSAGIDLERVIHVPIRNVEDFKFDIVGKLEMITEENKGKKDKQRVIIFVDSVGNLASKKEVQDAIDEKSVADMTRAKALKGLFRIITPYLTLEQIPCVVVNHVYSEQGMFPKTIMSGGCMAAGTKVRLADGSLKSIEEFKVGDLVETLEGPKSVTHTWDPETLEEGEPECYEIEFEDGFKVIVSDKHKFLLNNNWVEASKLKIGDEVTRLDG